jgi:hypothetical protein
MRILPWALLTLAVPSVAAAEIAGTADPVHDFHGVDRFTPRSTFGAALAYEAWDDNGFTDAPTVLGFDVGGHYLTPAGYGGYLVVPLSYLSVDSVISADDSVMALGNLDLGGLVTRRVRGIDVLGRVGLVLPTADDDGIEALQVLASVPRYGDLVQRAPDSSWLRLSGSAMGTRGALFWRGDVGLDLVLDEGDLGSGDLAPIFRLNLAGGIDLGATDVTVELATNVGDDDSVATDNTNTTLTLGARYDAGGVQPGLALLVPLGFDDQEDLKFALAVSLAWALPVGADGGAAADPVAAR